MGCCASSATSDQKDDMVSGENTSPSPSVDEKTVVKEVLSETTLVTSSNDNSTTKILDDPEKKPGAINAASDPVLTERGSVEPEKGSEVSEICSLSESLLSIVTGEDEEEVKHRKSQVMRQRSPAKSRNRVVVNYPTRLTDMSPRKRNIERERAGSVGQRDPTERSERRSRSPAINRSGMGPTRSQYIMENGVAVRKQSQSPGRVRRDPFKNGSEQDCKDHHQWPSYGAAGGNYNSTPKDSFENPLVSLECFIFL